MKAKKVLIVEDEAAMLDALSMKIEKAGFKTYKARDGEEGYNSALKNHPDLLIMDIIMPKMDGMTVIKKVREEGKWGAAVPVIMLTNLSDPESVSEAARYRVYDFLVKTDWRLEDVVNLVKQKLQGTD